MKQRIPLFLNIIALLVTGVLIASHFEYGGVITILISLLTISVGYILGAWTCHFHTRGRGLWITLGVFILLNLLHSMIDGASIGGLDGFGKGFAVLLHEVARQPALYLVLWAMLTPFAPWKAYRFFIVPFAVTGVWILGAYLGFEFFTHIEKVSWLEVVADQALFLFLGDILHHVYEEYQKMGYKNACCHDHAGE